LRNSHGAAVGPLSAPWLFLNVPQGPLYAALAVGLAVTALGVFGQAVGGRSRYTPAMADSTESLRRQLLEAREKVQAQIDKLRGLPTPLAGIGLEPVRANGLNVEGDALLAKLTETLRDIDDSLDELDGAP